MLEYIEKRIYRNKWRGRMLNEYLEYLTKKGNKPVSIAWVRDKGIVFWDWLNSVYPENKPVDNDMILAYLNYRRLVGKSESTVAGDFRALSAFFRWCYNTSRLPINPCDGVRAPRHIPCEQDKFTPSEIARILLYLETQHNYRDAAIILFLCDTGIRITAMTNIFKNDIDWDRRVSVVIDKYDKRRRLSWGNRTHKALLDYLNTRLDSSRYLFVNERKPVKLTRSGVYRMFQRACSGSGVIFRKPHLLRSYFATQFLIAGGPERVHQLRMNMGLADNSQIETVYANDIMSEQALESMRELSPGDRIPILPPRHQ